MSSTRSCSAGSERRTREPDAPALHCEAMKIVLVVVLVIALVVAFGSGFLPDVPLGDNFA
jgi:hypothetical protein